MNGLEFVRKCPSEPAPFFRGPRVRLGRAVLIARITKQALGDTTVYNDSLACANAQTQRMSKIVKNNITSSIKVYPNPSKDYIKIKYALNDDQQALFEIRDLTGRLLYLCKLNSNQTEKRISVSEYPVGFYLYYFKADGEKSSNGKITIIR